MNSRPRFKVFLASLTLTKSTVFMALKDAIDRLLGLMTRRKGRQVINRQR